MFFWTKESIQWYKQAAEYTEYYKVIYKEISPFIRETDTVCDLGCGLGYLSLELATKASKVTSIDIAENALEILKQNMIKKEINNIEIIENDWVDIPLKPQWDVVVTSFFKQTSKDILQLLAMCNKKVIAIVSNEPKNTLLPKQCQIQKTKHADGLIKDLTEKKIGTHYNKRYLDFGQPLYSKNEAKKFITHYAPECELEEIDKHLHTHLVTINADQFGNTFFLPRKYEIGIFIIEKKEKKP